MSLSRKVGAGLLSLLGLGCGQPPAPSRVAEVTGPGGRAAVFEGRQPELRFEGTRGEVVLRSTSDRFSAGEVPYAPLGFYTAPEPELAPPSFEAQEVPLPADGTRHRATRVLSTRTEGDRSVVELATDDPEGRTLTVELATGEGDTLRVDVSVSDPEGVTGVFAAFDSDEGEAFHGFGGRREGTDLRGQAFANWVFDYRFPDVSSAYYYPVPAFVSSAGYGLWLETDRMARFRMASDVPDAWRVAVEGSSMRLIVAPGEGAQPLRAITELTGRHRVAPAWSMGPMLSRTIQILEDDPEKYQAKVEDDVSRVLSGELPIEAYAYEGWPMLPVDQVEETNRQLREAGVHPVLYIRSFLADDIAGTEPPGRLAEAVEAGYVATTVEGEPYTFPSPFDESDAVVVDFTNPDAVAWWKGLVTEMLELGADGFMNDFGEQVLPDMVFSDGSTGRTMHNRYPVLQHRVTREAVDAFMAEHPDREIFFFVRAGYAGRPGSATYENASFPGDETVGWEPSTGLPSIVPDMLNRSILGSYGFSTDIGGYADFDGEGTDPELFSRWTEAAVFTTHFRVHNSALTGVRMPWSFDARTETLFAEMGRLHQRVRPLLRSLWQEATETGVPPVRPLWLEDPQAEGNPHNDDQWMVGHDVLVAPVLEQGATRREVWLPEGCWRLHGEGEQLEGRQTVSVDAPLEVLPWFVRCGTDPF